MQLNIKIRMVGNNSPGCILKKLCNFTNWDVFAHIWVSNMHWESWKYSIMLSPSYDNHFSHSFFLGIFFLFFAAKLNNKKIGQPSYRIHQIDISIFFKLYCFDCNTQQFPFPLSFSPQNHTITIILFTNRQYFEYQIEIIHSLTKCGISFIDLAIPFFSNTQ